LAHFVAIGFKNGHGIEILGEMRAGNLAHIFEFSENVGSGRLILLRQFFEQPQKGW
jgi:hypothetical protein